MVKCRYKSGIQKIEANKETATEQGRKAGVHIRAQASIHPLAVCVIELRLGLVFPTFYTFSFHPDLDGAMHMDLFLLLTNRLWNLTRATPIGPVSQIPREWQRSGKRRVKNTYNQ